MLCNGNVMLGGVDLEGEDVVRDIAGLGSECCIGSTCEFDAVVCGLGIALECCYTAFDSGDLLSVSLGVTVVVYACFQFVKIGAKGCDLGCESIVVGLVLSSDSFLCFGIFDSLLDFAVELREFCADSVDVGLEVVGL